MRDGRLRAMGAVLGTLALWVGSAVAAAPALAAATPAGASGTSAGVGISALGLGGWRVLSTASATQPGGEISLPGFPTAGWLGVTPDDAGAPGTDVEALLQNGVCLHDPSFAIHEGPPEDGHDVFFSDNLRRCFGQTTTVGPVTIPELSVPWWFRTDFQASPRPGQRAVLVVNGVVGQADVWVDGVEVATQTTVRGAFASREIDVTDVLRPGANSLAMELYPNDPTAMLTVDNVDWTQIPPDNNTGIQFPVQLHVAGGLAIGDAHVAQDDAPDLSSAALTVRADVTNGTAAAQTGTVSATVTPPAGGGSPIRLAQTVTVPAGTTRTVAFSPATASALTIRRPRVWWPYQMGDQPLYRLDASVAQGGTVTDTAPAVTFGIRTVSTYLTAPSTLARDGVRVFAINGRPFVFRGGGFGENLFLHYSARDLANQVTLIRSLGLDAIRTEGKEMPADFYAQMDRAGILIDAGFQCCDAWQPADDGTGVTAGDFRDMEAASFTIGQRLRDHPSVVNFSWSDNAPILEQEAASLRGFARAGFDLPVSSGGVPYAPFARGDGAAQDDAYTITVANAGFAPTAGAVTVAVDLPAGLTPLSISGAGWSCAAAAATCTTRPGVSLAEGAQRSITLRVAVAANADRSAFPLVRVSGGGEIVAGNGAAVVPTNVGP